MADLIDYDSKQAAILSALRKAQELQQSEAPPVQYKQFGQIDHVIAPGPLSGVAAAINRGMGDIQESQINRQQSQLDKQQMGEVQDYQRQLLGVPNETRRVLKQALGGATGTLNQPELQPGEIPTPAAPAQPEYEDVPLSPVEQNARRMDIAQSMYRLPKARAMGMELWKKGIEFPEKDAELQSKLVQAKQLADDRNDLKAQLQGQSEDIKLKLAQMGIDAKAVQNASANEIAMLRVQLMKEANDISRGRAEVDAEKKRADIDDRKAKADAKVQAASDAHEKTASAIDMEIANIDRAIGKRDANNALLPDQKEFEGFNDYVGAYTGPGSSLIPGNKAAQFEPLHAQILASARVTGMQNLKGTGSVSGPEGEAAQRALQAIAQKLTPKNYVDNVRIYRDILQKAADRERRGVKVRDNGVEYPDPVRQAAKDEQAKFMPTTGPITQTTQSGAAIGGSERPAGAAKPTGRTGTETLPDGTKRRVREMSDGTTVPIEG